MSVFKSAREKDVTASAHEGSPEQEDRRQFLKAMGAVAATGFFAACDESTRELLFRKHFRELDADEKRRLVAHIERRYQKKSGVKIKVGAEPPLEGVVFGYALDLARCIGCRKCVYACVKENNQSRDPQVHYIRVLEIPKEAGALPSEGNAYYDAKKVPRDGYFYMPIACHMCEDSPCERVCPVGATWREEDGIVVIDYDRCIGCRYCMASCPYGARKFNWGEPSIPKKEINRDTHYLGNRPRPKGVVEKCHFCIQRVRKGRYPACVEICPVGARKFGNLLDPKSEVRYVLANKRVFVLKEELNTRPKFFYFYG